MNTHRFRAAHQVRSHGQNQRGFVLVAGLLFLVVITMLGVTMFRSTGLQERIAGNTRDKQRAFEAAQSALQLGEFWVDNNADTGGIDCSALTTPLDVTDPADALRICAVPLTDAEAFDLANNKARINYKPSGMNVSSGGGVVASGDINYQAPPSLYIAYMGYGSEGQLYQVTAAGLGGNASTMSVVRSTYVKPSPAVVDLSGK